MAQTVVLGGIAENKGFRSTSRHRSSTGDSYANAVVITDCGCEGSAGTCCLLVAEDVGGAKAGGTSTRTWTLSLPKSGYSIGSCGGAVSSSKCKKCSVMLLKVERIRCKQMS